MKERIRKLILLRVLVLVLAAVLATGTLTGCTEEVTEWELTEWNIPQITILTGPGAPFGLDAKWGVDRAVKEINDAGGINGVPVKVTHYDTAFDPVKAVQVMAEVLGTNPLVIVGPMDQTGGEASGDLAVDEGVPFMTSFAAPYLRARFEPWSASLYPDSDKACAVGTREYLRLNPDVKSVVEIYCPMSAAHVMNIEEQEKMLDELGITVLGKIEVTFGQLDLGPQAVQAMALEPDAYLSMLNVAEYALFCKALYERGMTEGRRIVAGAGVTGGYLFEAGEGFIEDTYIWDNYDFTSTSPQWQAYVAAYEAEHDGQFPYSLAIHGQYEAVYAIKAAIEELGITGDPEKLAEERLAIRDFLWNAKDIIDPMGEKWSYTEGEKVRDPMYMYQVHNNELQLVDTFSPEW